MAMAINPGASGDPDVLVDINTTPLIDVMLVLLIMLIITIPIQLHSVNMNMPVGNPPPPLVQPEVVRITIDATGTVAWNGEALGNMPDYRRARLGLCLVPEDRRIFTDLTVMENLEVGRQPPREGAPTWTPERLFELFPNLGRMRDRPGGRMSGGEQQMLTIARALMMRPRLLILDEPTLGLAPVILELLSKALEKRRQTTPITVLLGEQNVTFALPHADRVYVLEQARIVWEGPPQRFASEMGSAYL